MFSTVIMTSLNETVEKVLEAGQVLIEKYREHVGSTESEYKRLGLRLSGIKRISSHLFPCP